jgi:hypothetical protein
MEVTPLGTVQVPEPEVKVIMQLLSLATPLAEIPETVGEQLASVRNAFALGAVRTEIVESVETIKTKESA